MGQAPSTYFGALSVIGPVSGCLEPFVRVLGHSFSYFWCPGIASCSCYCKVLRTWILFKSRGPCTRLAARARGQFPFFLVRRMGTLRFRFRVSYLLIHEGTGIATLIVTGLFHGICLRAITLPAQQVCTFFSGVTEQCR